MFCTQHTITKIFLTSIFKISYFYIEYFCLMQLINLRDYLKCTIEIFVFLTIFMYVYCLSNKKGTKSYFIPYDLSDFSIPFFYVQATEFSYSTSISI